MSSCGSGCGDGDFGKSVGRSGEVFVVVVLHYVVLCCVVVL